jgi:hypothetical protein
MTKSKMVIAAEITGSAIKDAKSRRVKSADISKEIRKEVAGKLYNPSRKKNILTSEGQTSNYFHNLMHVVNNGGKRRDDTMAPIHIRQALGMKISAAEMKSVKGVENTKAKPAAKKVVAKAKPKAKPAAKKVVAKAKPKAKPQAIKAPLPSAEVSMFEQSDSE